MTASPPFLVFVTEQDQQLVYTIYTDLPADDAEQLRQHFAQTHDQLYPAQPAQFMVRPLADAPHTERSAGRWVTTCGAW